MSTAAEEQAHTSAHEAAQAQVADAWQQALRNELGLLESHLAASRVGREFEDLERRIGEIKALLGGRGGKRSAVKTDPAAQTRT